jgi:lipoprotein-anchoring transpeptidase ErfK/SrfK
LRVIPANLPQPTHVSSRTRKPPHKTTCPESARTALGTNRNVARLIWSKRSEVKGTTMKTWIMATALAAAIATTGPAYAANGSAVAVDEAAATLMPNRYIWNDAAPEAISAEPVTVVVSIPQQRAFVYRGDMLVAASSVSTGKDGKETPVGVYPILQKNEDHKSNLYNAAPMPFMQRLTWDGIALHAGRNPGFPDSHGCVRLPAAFAKKLFGITQLGTTVVVTDMDVVGNQLDRSLLETEASRANAEQLAMLGQ